MMLNWARIMPTYWLVWFLSVFTTFIVPEVWWLVNNKYLTLSWTLWHLEDFIPGEGIQHWTAAHFLIGGVLLVLLVWLIGHLVIGWWT